MPDAIELIRTERQRQIDKEGWTIEHDDKHAYEELAAAAACYVAPVRPDSKGVIHSPEPKGFVPAGWPWEDEWWKPEPDDRIRELVKAGALIAAEIERLQRTQLKETQDA